jgi:hypothetical protein
MLSEQNYGEITRLFTELTSQEAADVNGGFLNSIRKMVRVPRFEDYFCRANPEVDWCADLLASWEFTGI